MVSKKPRAGARVLVAGLVIMFSSPAASAQNTHIFDQLAGSWSGRGIIVHSVGANEEAIRCRLRNRSTHASARKLVLAGNCAVAGLVLPMGGWMQQQDDSNRYTASMFQSLARLKTDSFDGTRRGRQLRFHYQGTDAVSKQSISARITIIARGDNRFDIQVRRTDPTTKKLHNVGTIEFSRR